MAPCWFAFGRRRASRLAKHSLSRKAEPLSKPFFACVETHAPLFTTPTPPHTPGRLLMDAYEKLEKIGEGTYGKVRPRKRRARAPGQNLRERVAMGARAHTLQPSPPHAQVYKAREKATGRLVALKKTRLEVSVGGREGECARAPPLLRRPRRPRTPLDAPSSRHACTGDQPARAEAGGGWTRRGFGGEAARAVFARARRAAATRNRRAHPHPPQMEEEGVPSTALREVSLLQMLSESNHVVK